MQHVAIDLGGQESQICVRDDKGQLVEEVRWGTRKLAQYLRGQPMSRIVMETSSEAFHLADLAMEMGHEVKVVPSALAPTLGVGSRGVKTDRRDARVLSEVSSRIELPSVHIPSTKSRERKAACTARESLVSARTQLINTVRGWLRTQLLSVRTCVPSVFPERVRRAALAGESGHALYIEQILVVIESLNQQIAGADKELKQMAQHDTLCQLLMTVPGVGTVTAIRFIAAVDDVSRFATAHQLQSFLGLVPGENSNSNRKQRTSITKAGPPRVRWALGQAVWSMRKARPLDPLVQWALQVEKRRGRKIAMTAMARRLAGIMYAMWRDQARYQPSKLLQRQP
ncbi:MAG: IS110 family transposase [Polyangiaceae bacterium]